MQHRHARRIHYAAHGRLTKGVAKLVGRERVCRVSTAGRTGVAHVVPICHVVVTVNAIAPGPVDTALTAPILGLPQAREEFLRHIPVGRIGRPADIARMVLFLAAEAADWITGQTFYVDGGQSLVALPPYIDLVERLTGGGFGGGPGAA